MLQPTHVRLGIAFFPLSLGFAWGLLDAEGGEIAIFALSSAIVPVRLGHPTVRWRVLEIRW
jgi:hypothetical protein